MIKGLIKANNEGFKNPTKQKGLEKVVLAVKSDRPTKFQKRQVAFYNTNFKNPTPTAFTPEQIKEDSVYGPKVFNNISYNEDPFKELFGYTKRINPDDNLNPKFYEFKLGNKNENSFIVENLQAENGTATNDVEQREALKDFLELRRLQEEADEEYDGEIGRASSKKERRSVGRPKKSTAGGGGTIDIEPIAPRRDVFKEFEDKTDIGDFKVLGELATKGNAPSEAELKTLIDGVEKYTNGTTTDRS
jgi:hypothetical protein